MESIELFNYQSLDVQTSNYLQEKEFRIKSILNNSATEIGKELKEAQEKLAKNGYGSFGNWIENCFNFTRQTAYNLIGRYDLIVKQFDNQKIIEALPTNLSYAISKPSAPPELVEKTLSGEIESLSRYKIELEKLKAQNEILKENNQTLELNLSKKPNEIIKEVIKIETKEIENPRTRELLNQTQTKLNNKESEITTLTNELNKLRHLAKKETEIKNLQDKIYSAQKEHSDLLKNIDNLTEILTFLRHTKEYISNKMFPIIAFKSVSIPDETKKEFQSIFESLENWIYSTKQKFNIG